MNNNVLNYLRGMEGKNMRPGVECNSMVANILSLLHPNENKELINKIIIELENCSNFKQIKNTIKWVGTSRTVLNLYGYKEVNDTKILKGDFLIKPRRYFDDCMFMIDHCTKSGLSPRKLNDKIPEFTISRKLHVSTKHKIYRR